MEEQITFVPARQLQVIANTKEELASKLLPDETGWCNEAACLFYKTSDGRILPAFMDRTHRIGVYANNGASVIIDYDILNVSNPLSAKINKNTLMNWAARGDIIVFSPDDVNSLVHDWAIMFHAALHAQDASFYGDLFFCTLDIDTPSKITIYDIYTLNTSTDVFFKKYSETQFENVAHKSQVINASEESYPSCKAVKMAIDASKTFDTVYDGSVSNNLAAQNHTLHVFDTASANLMIALETEDDGKAPADFAAEIMCDGDCEVTLTINGIDASESIAGGHAMEEGKFYQLTCFGTCYTLAEFTKPNTVVIGGTHYPFVQVHLSETSNKLWMVTPLDYQWPGLTVGESSLSLTDPQANYYDDDASAHDQAGDKYGLLYNGAAAQYLEANRNTLLPKGWRLPTYEEIQELADAVGGYSVAGKGLKSDTGWNSGTGLGDFELDFKPTGLFTGSFSGLGTQAMLWASGTPSSDSAGCTYAFSTGDELTLADDTPKQYGCAIRLVKDLV